MVNVSKKIMLKLSSLEFRFIKRRAKYYGYTVNAQLQPFDNELVIKNVFGTSYNKNALLSYIIEPFKSSVSKYHSNHQECYAIAEILKELKYNVDVINWDNVTYMPDKEYDVVIDNHNNLKRLSEGFKNRPLKIFHATNTYWLYQNAIEFKRCQMFFEEKGVMIVPTRLRPEGNSVAFADAVSMFGNKFTANTYGIYANKVIHLPMSVTSQSKYDKNKNFNVAKNNFLWLNSYGAMLKGLDVVIDVFVHSPQFELFICYSENEDKQFFEAMKSELDSSPNIHLIGWVDIEGSDYLQLVSKCCWVISASWSEGGGGSILNCMASGLIPVITPSCSISLPEECGFYIENESIDSITSVLNTVTNLNNDILNRMSEKSVDFIFENHTLENFKNKYRAFVLHNIT